MSEETILFLFIHNYVNYTNIPWASTSKSKFERLYHCQKHAARAIDRSVYICKSSIK